MAQTHAAQPHVRRTDLDLLTALGSLAVLLFHCARAFDAEGWHVKAAPAWPLAGAATSALALWLMPLFFALSGFSALLALQATPPLRWLRGRALRLGLPFAFGVLVLLAPFQVWIERLGQGAFRGSLWAFYPHYFEGLYAFGGNFAWMGLHLWYLAMLLLFSALALPGLAPLARRRGRDGMPLAELALPGLGLALLEPLLALDPQGLGIRAFGGWSPVSYLLLFCSGFALARRPGHRAALSGLWPWLLGAGLGAAWLALTGGGVPALMARGACCWLLVTGLLGLAAAHAPREGALLARAREAALPFYVLHQPVIVGLGFVLAGIEADAGVKYLLLAGGSLAGTLALYALAVRPWAWMRPLLGLAPHPRPPDRGAR